MKIILWGLVIMQGAMPGISHNTVVPFEAFASCCCKGVA